MAVPRFFMRGGLSRDALHTTIALPEEVVHHAVRVVRLAAGDALTLFDGTGGEYAATIVSVDKRGAQVRIEAFHAVERESPLAITLVQAIVATDAMDAIVRRAVELGVAAIVPVITARSAVLPAGERTAKRSAHWAEIAMAACEQCGRNRVPAIRMPVPLADYIAEPDASLFVCMPGAASPRLAFSGGPRPCAVVIGPEGGFTADEQLRLAALGARQLALGPRVLRSDTAALAAIALLQAASGDLH